MSNSIELINLSLGLIRNWMSTTRVKSRMYRDLPRHFRKDWQSLPWSRYQYFYGVLVPVIIHDAMLRLHQIPTTHKLQKTMTTLALITGIFDDLFDKLHIPVSRIYKLIESPRVILPSDEVEEYLCQYIYKEICQNFPGNRDQFRTSVHCMVAVQEKSQQQSYHSGSNVQTGPLSLEDILCITNNKGAEAILFYRSCIDKSMEREERQFLNHLGGLFQMTNDINDALKDENAGESTIMTIGLPIREIRNIFNKQINKTKESWKLLTDDEYQKKQFFTRINILLSRSHITLDRYESHTDPSQPFDIKDIPGNKVISGLKVPFELWRWRQYIT